VPQAFRVDRALFMVGPCVKPRGKRIHGGLDRRTLGRPVLPDVYTTVTTSSGLLGTAIGNAGFCIVATENVKWIE
jgi:hypothetical protein